MHPDEAAAAAAACRLVATTAAAAIARKGAAVIALSGGSQAAQLAPLAGPLGAAVDWSKVHVFLADERLVPPSSPDCTLSAHRAAWLDAAGVPAGNVHGAAEGVAPAAAAAAYEALLLGLPVAVLPRDGSGQPVLDLVLLGLGQDGHTASLFPNRSALAPTPKTVLPVTDSPKPPAARITLSLSAINAAAAVAFLAAGASKAEAVQRVLECQALPGALPAQLVRPAAGLVWLLDAASAGQLRVERWGVAKAWPRSEV